ncbi:low-temperature-induced 65 kDa protein-like [Momordica charantia]|uniref:Low-temperature-induced 65 kDa protein-like n=1 Tax=Momordica charantia TaxID=3673 RepID=A0A6J1DNM6_MOMCH|nr:low-temperature-induced 65 kDa protein-like [Momordica charantia]
MQSQQIAPHHHPHAHQGVDQGDNEEDHEKKSVLKKVKAKAKKIKDTITKHGHHPHHYEDNEEDDDEDEDEAVVEDPQLQGAPLYEGAAMRSGVAPTPTPTPDVGFGRSTVMHHWPPPPPTETTSRSAVDAGFATKEKEVDRLDNSAVAPNTTMSLSPLSLEEDPHAPPKQPHAPLHSEVKASDPAAIGSQEAGSGSSEILDSFAKMKVNDENRANRAGNEAGDQQSSYGQKISAVGSALAGTAISAKDFVASKLGYGVRTGEGEDKGVSVKEYLAQKLEPGEDDRALLEAISEAFQKRKEEVPPKAEVTESEELTRRLGREDNRETERSSTAAATAAAARSVVDTVKDTVGSWMGKGGDSPPSQQQQGPGGTEAEVRIL